MKKIIKKLLREERDPLLDKILDTTITSPRLEKIRKRLIDDEGYLDLNLIIKMGFVKDWIAFDKYYPNVLNKFTAENGIITWKRFCLGLWVADYP